MSKTIYMNDGEKLLKLAQRLDAEAINYQHWGLNQVNLPGLITDKEELEEPKNFVTVDFYASRDCHITLAFKKNKKFYGFIDQELCYYEELLIDQDYKKGDYCFAVLVKKDATEAKGSKILKSYYWNLLCKSDENGMNRCLMTVNSGVPSEDIRQLALAVGWKDGLIESNKREDFIIPDTQIPCSLQKSHEGKMRGFYQCMCRYLPLQGRNLQLWIRYLNGASTDEARFYSSMFEVRFTPRSYDYKTRYFAEISQ